MKEPVLKSDHFCEMLFGDQRVWLAILDAFHAYHEVILPSIHIRIGRNLNTQINDKLLGCLNFGLITEGLIFLPIIVYAGAVFGGERLVLVLELFKVLQVDA